ncbi:hypothetical protein GYMLUDRAFT_60424 [Collybiopsis luxurians FD-317 M1]|uniref:Uncharacterized protein n=1 Tax=Collybiopsis luxurians FD-317 M1 TaxID=944289 RepID=A0A0D0CT51_9AGAR|nr:hypothetical protein GYMLUDRAFT_60424 [Collybiopsis luxurians FD-317 M1]
MSPYYSWPEQLPDYRSPVSESAGGPNLAGIHPIPENFPVALTGDLEQQAIDNLLQHFNIQTMGDWHEETPQRCTIWCEMKWHLLRLKVADLSECESQFMFYPPIAVVGHFFQD